MEINIYLHRTKKKQFEVAERITVVVDFDKLSEDKQKDINFVNTGFHNDAKRLARMTESVRKYGTGYISFLRPQYEGPEEENGNEYMYFDNERMLFVERNKEEKE